MMAAVGTSVSRLFGTAADPKGAALNWYFATNEQGSEGFSGLHARLAVLSALQNTRLRPHLITTGFRNDFTAWMEAHGVRIIEARQPLADAIRSADAAGGYSTAYLGHWLRCEIPEIENTEAYVLYTDTDVVFRRGVVLPKRLPAFIAAAPEFDIATTSYFNSGVMLMNVSGLRRELPDFFAFARREIGALRGEVYHDQFAYNRFYRSRWQRCDPGLNWKPYWGDPSNASIIHFHGAKLHAVAMLYEADIPFAEDYWRIVGSLVASFREGYRQAIEATLDAVSHAELPERAWIAGLARRLSEGPPPVPASVIDLDFLKTDFTD